METKRSRLRISELNPHLLCALCGGYLIDATTIVECLHSFCKTCIVRYLETSNYCPICEVLIHKKRPWQNIRLDHTLQNVVYKLVPGLFKNEMQRRRDYYDKNPPPGGKDSLQEQVHIAPERIIFSEDEKFSVSLEFSPNGRPIQYTQTDVNDTKPQHRDKRFLLCPANLCIAHLKKFVRLKYSLPESYLIDLFYSDEPLEDSYTLMDVAYIYSWRRESMLTLYYSFHQPLAKPRKSSAAATATSQDKHTISDYIKTEPAVSSTAAATTATTTTTTSTTPANPVQMSMDTLVASDTNPTMQLDVKSEVTAVFQCVGKEHDVISDDDDDDEYNRPLVICTPEPAARAADMVITALATSSFSDSNLTDPNSNNLKCAENGSSIDSGIDCSDCQAVVTSTAMTSSIDLIHCVKVNPTSKNSTAPCAKISVSSSDKVSTSSSARISNSPGTKLSDSLLASPASKLSAVPTVKVTASCKSTTSPHAKLGTGPTSTKEKASSSAKITSSDNSKMTANAGSKITVSPSAKVTASPSAKVTSSLNAKVTASPSAKVTASPNAKVAASPSAKVTVSPSSKVTASPIAKDTVIASTKVAASLNVKNSNEKKEVGPSVKDCSEITSKTASETSSTTTCTVVNVSTGAKDAKTSSSNSGVTNSVVNSKTSSVSSTRNNDGTKSSVNTCTVNSVSGKSSLDSFIKSIINPDQGIKSSSSTKSNIGTSIVNKGNNDISSSTEASGAKSSNSICAKDVAGNSPGVTTTTSPPNLGTNTPTVSSIKNGGNNVRMHASQSGSSSSRKATRSPPMGIFDRIYSVTSNCTATGIKTIIKSTAIPGAGSPDRRASFNQESSASSKGVKVESRRASSSGVTGAMKSPASVEKTHRVYNTGILTLGITLAKDHSSSGSGILSKEKSPSNNAFHKNASNDKLSCSSDEANSIVSKDRGHSTNGSSGASSERHAKDNATNGVKRTHSDSGAKHVNYTSDSLSESAVPAEQSSKLKEDASLDQGSCVTSMDIDISDHQYSDKDAAKDNKSHLAPLALNYSQEICKAAKDSVMKNDKVSLNGSANTAGNRAATDSVSISSRQDKKSSALVTGSGTDKRSGSETHGSNHSGKRPKLQESVDAATTCCSMKDDSVLNNSGESCDDTGLLPSPNNQTITGSNGDSGKINLAGSDSGIGKLTVSSSTTNVSDSSVASVSKSAVIVDIIKSKETESCHTSIDRQVTLDSVQSKSRGTGHTQSPNGNVTKLSNIGEASSCKQESTERISGSGESGQKETNADKSRTNTFTIAAISGKSGAGIKRSHHSAGSLPASSYESASNSKHGFSQVTENAGETKPVNAASNKTLPASALVSPVGVAAECSETKKMKMTTHISSTASSSVITPTILSSSSISSGKKSTSRGCDESGPSITMMPKVVTPSHNSSNTKTAFIANLGSYAGFVPIYSRPTLISLTSARHPLAGNRVDSLLFRAANRTMVSTAEPTKLGGSAIGSVNSQKHARSEKRSESSKTNSTNRMYHESSNKSALVASAANRDEISFSAQRILSKDVHAYGSILGKSAASTPNPVAKNSLTSSSTHSKAGHVKHTSTISGACDLSSKTSVSLAEDRRKVSSSRKSESITLDIPRLSSSSKDSVFGSDSETSPTPPPKFSDINRNPIKLDYNSSKSSRRETPAPIENGGRNSAGSLGSVGSPSPLASCPGSPVECERSPVRDARRPSDSELLMSQRWHNLYPHLLPLHGHSLHEQAMAAAALYNGHFKVPAVAKFLPMVADHVRSNSPEPMPLDYSTTSSSSKS